MRKDYASYFTPGPDATSWGVALTASGFTRIAANSSYPPQAPGRHPLDHLFTWEHGRILQAYQVIYILDGRGMFDSHLTGELRVEPGTIFLLFPGVWHRYRPERGIGWTESWIELTGASLERLVHAGILSPRTPLHLLGRRPSLEGAFEEIHRLALAREPGFQPVMAALGLEILARLQQAPMPRKPADCDAAAAVRRAQEDMSAQLDRVINIEGYARDAGISYSAFRHTFRATVGVSPKQFHLQMRLRKATDLLQNTNLSVLQIAQALGFSSSFHFSICFKRHTGLAPSLWRDQRTRESTARSTQ